MQKGIYLFFSLAVINKSQCGWIEWGFKVTWGEGKGHRLH